MTITENTGLVSLFAYPMKLSIETTYLRMNTISAT